MSLSRPRLLLALVLALVVAVIVAVNVGCEKTTPATPSTKPAGPPFVDIAAESGLDFTHRNGAEGKRYIVEIMGSGGGFIDYDGDGDLDVVLLDGGPVEDPADGTHRLFRNVDGRFADVTAESGLAGRGYAMGLAVGDIDGDGDADLFVTHYGADVLYRNLGNGQFEDITATAGVGDARWTSSATFFDYDNDGDLDLYVAGYLDFSPARFRPCSLRGHPIYCGPDAYDGIPDRLYENDGSGHFRDVSAETGIAAHIGKGLGVVAGDYDDDGDQDLYVANDGTANFIFINRHDEGMRGFREEGIFYGVSFGESAKAEAGMGVDFGDYDGDGDPDIVCTNLDAQTNSLYRNDDGIAATESSFSAGLSAATIPWVGFGVRFLDHDLDGDLDLFVTNGHIMDNIADIRQGALFAQDDQLFENDMGYFKEILRGSVPRRVGRGLATGDVDDDGDVDVLITNNGGAPLLLRNDMPRKGDAAGLVLRGKPGLSNRDAYGARVTWEAFGRTRRREVRAGASYCSASDARLLLAVESGTGDVDVTIRWPGGTNESVRLAVGAYHTVTEGSGLGSSTPFR